MASIFETEVSILETIAYLNKSITEMEKAAVIPQQIIDQHKIDKKKFDDHLTMCRKFLDKQMDKGMQIYRIKNINFYMAYTAARKVRHYHVKRKTTEVDLETTTGILELLVFDKSTAMPLPNVKLVVAALNLVTNTDEDGETYSDKLIPGKYQGKLFCDGYKTIDIEIIIEAGKSCTKQFLMETL